MNLSIHLQELNLPLHANFVAPVLCKDLIELGIEHTPHFIWKIQNGQPFIWSKSFDPDGYYNTTESIIEKHIITTINIPAFSASDLEKIIGNFLHICTAGDHEVTPTQFPRIGTRKAPRYADAIALVAIELIKRGIIKPAQVNKLITQ